MKKWLEWKTHAFDLSTRQPAAVCQNNGRFGCIFLISMFFILHGSIPNLANTLQAQNNRDILPIPQAFCLIYYFVLEAMTLLQNKEVKDQIAWFTNSFNWLAKLAFYWIGLKVKFDDWLAITFVKTSLRLKLC